MPQGGCTGIDYLHSSRIALEVMIYTGREVETGNWKRKEKLKV